MNFAVLLDVSKSMGFGSAGVTKLDYGRMLAGCLTYLVHRQRDRVGLVAFDTRHRRDSCRPRPSTWTWRCTCSTG